MKRNINNMLRAGLAILLLFCLCTSISCNEYKEEPLVYSNDNSVGISYYELMLSRMRGTLARSGYDVEDPNFWSTDSGIDGKTYEEYYNDMIFENCKTAVAALEIFDELGLSLPSSYVASIEEEIDFFVSYDGDESEDKLNDIIAPYGVNIDSLREAYLIEAKVSYLKAHIYGADGSLIGDAVKDEYYRDNYHRFKQILIQNFYYEYEKDDFGNEIYYNPENGKIVYDKKNGEPRFDEKNNYIVDKFNSPIYYDAEGRILYDKENGTRSITKDENGEVITHYYAPDIMQERYDEAVADIDKLEAGDTYAFEELMEKYNDTSSEIYVNGYYVSDIEKSGYQDYMMKILDKLNEMETGQIEMVETDYGYHFVMKYELDDGAYADDIHKDWFESFNATLVEKMFLERCKSKADKVNVNDELHLSTRSISEIGTNFNY